jgi:hypothetical protein
MNLKLTPKQRLASSCPTCSQDGTSCLAHTCLDCLGYVPGDFAHECPLGPPPPALPDPATSPTTITTQPTITQRSLPEPPELTPTELEDEREQDLADFINNVTSFAHFRV